MTGNDRGTSRHMQRVATMARNMTSDADNIATGLLYRSDVPPSNRPKLEGIRSRSDVSRPTENAAMRWHSVQLADAGRFTRLLMGHETLDVLGARQMCDRIGQPLDPTYPVGAETVELEKIAEIACDRDPATREWRLAVFAVAGLWNVAAESILDGWYALHQSCWQQDSRGVTVLDQTAEYDTLMWVQQIEKLRGRLHGLALSFAGGHGLRLCKCGCRRPLLAGERGPQKDACYKRSSRKKISAGNL